MARYIFGDNGKKSGRSGADVFMRNGVSRNMVTPFNHTTPYNDFFKDALTFYSSQWHLLSQASMQLWLNFKLIHHNNFNEVITVTGKDAFVSCNIRVATITNNNLIVHVSVPSNEIVTPAPITILNLTPIKIDILNNFDLNPNSVIISATLNMSPGIFKPRKCDFRIIGITSFAASSSQSVLADFTARFTAIPIVGQKIFIRSQVVNSFGIASAICQCSEIVI